MNRNELIDDYHETLKRKGLSKRRVDSKKYLDTALDVIFDNVTKGHHLTITDFGTFKSTLRSFNNFKDKGLDDIEAWVIKFIPSLKMKSKINEKKIDRRRS